MPHPTQPELAEVVENRLPGWKVTRHEPPGTAAFQDVKDGIEYVAQGMDPHLHIFGHLW
jgi:hypothetical protein